MKIFVGFLLFSLAEAKWGIGFCRNVPQKEEIDNERFEGHWYEVFRDKHHQFFSDQLCSEDLYKLSKNKKTMYLTRKFNNKLLKYPTFDFRK